MIARVSLALLVAANLLPLIGVLLWGWARIRSLDVVLVRELQGESRV